MKNYQELLRQARDGNRSAFAELVRRFSDMASAVAVQRLRDHAMAEDAVQEAFLAAWLHLSGLRDPDSFPAWLRSIVVRSCLRILRANGLQVATARLDDLEDIPGDDLDPVEHFARFQTRDAVLAFLASLSGVYREAAVQRYLLGRSYEEISLALGAPVGTIKRRLHETRDRMMRAVAGQHRQTIRVGYLPISDHLLPMVAHQRHDQATFHICLRKFLSWTQLAKALVNESLDAAMLMAPLAMVLHNRGLPLRWVMDGHHEGSAITVHSSIARNLTGNPGRALTRNLGGAALGLPHPLSTHGMLLRTMLGFGQTGGSGPFRAVYMNPSSMQRPLAKGELDGFFCAEPWGLLAEAAGTGRIMIRSRDLTPDHVCCILAVRDDFARSNPELLASYVNLLHAAADYVYARPQESAAIQSRYTGVDRDVAAFVLDRGFVSFHDLSPDRSRAAGVMNLALQAGILETPCDLDSLLPPGAN